MKKTDNMNNPIEELRRMEVPVTEEEWTSIVNDKRYVQKFGRKPGLTPKGRAAIVAGIAAVLITVPILVKTLRQQPANQVQPATPATEVATPQPTENQSVATIATSPSTSAQKPTTTPSATPETKPTVATTTEAAAHEGSTMASIIEKRHPAVTPTNTPAQDNNELSYETIKVSPKNSTPIQEVQQIKTVYSCSPSTKDKSSVSETTVTGDGEEVAKSEYSPDEPEATTEEFYIPSAFTPNGDGLNDIFYVTANFEPQHFAMYILNRNGELIFSTTDIRIGWDGTLHGSFLPSDVYVYMIKYVDRNGDHQQRRGQILLIP